MKPKALSKQDPTNPLNQYPSFVKQIVPNVPPFTCYSTQAHPIFFTKNAHHASHNTQHSSQIPKPCPQYPTFFTNCKTLPTIPNILHKLQNLAAIPPLTPIQDLPKERYAFAIPHNTQHSSPMVKALLQFHTNMGFSRNSKNLAAIPEQQHLAFFTKNLIAIPTTPNIVAIRHLHTQHFLQNNLIAILTIPNILHTLQNLAAIPPTFNTRSHPTKI